MEAVIHGARGDGRHGGEVPAGSGRSADHDRARVGAAAQAVLDRLARIDRLGQEGVAAAALLRELRLLLREAEEWTAVEGGEAGEEAVGRLRSALARDMIGV